MGWRSHGTRHAVLCLQKSWGLKHFSWELYLVLLWWFVYFLEYILTIDGVRERDMYSLLFYKEFTGPKIMDPEIVFMRTNRSYWCFIYFLLNVSYIFGVYFNSLWNRRTHCIARYFMRNSRLWNCENHGPWNSFHVMESDGQLMLFLYWICGSYVLTIIKLFSYQNVYPWQLAVLSPEACAPNSKQDIKHFKIWLKQAAHKYK